jgi:hypothetical protein
MVFINVRDADGTRVPSMSAAVKVPGSIEACATP